MFCGRVAPARRGLPAWFPPPPPLFLFPPSPGRLYLRSSEHIFCIMEGSGGSGGLPAWFVIGLFALLVALAWKRVVVGDDNHRKFNIW